MEFRDRPSLTKGTHFTARLRLAMALCPHPRHGDGHSPTECPRFTLHFPVSVVDLLLSSVGWDGEGMLTWRRYWAPHRGPPQVWFPLPHTQHKQRASLCPPTAFTANAVLTLITPPPTCGPTSSSGQGIMGTGAKLGAQEWGRGKRKELLSYLTSLPAGEGSRGKRRGAWRVLFYLLFPDFFVSKLADLYYTRTANKGRI